MGDFALQTVCVQQSEIGAARRGHDADAFICPVVIHRAVKFDHVNGFNVKFRCSMKFVAAAGQETA